MLGNKLEETPYSSVFMSMWYILTTITTVGYGDMFPTSIPGRLFGGAAMIMGMIGFAMPVSFIGTVFAEEYARLDYQQSEIREEEQRMSDVAEGERASPVGSYSELKELETTRGQMERLEHEVSEINRLTNSVNDLLKKIDPSYVDKNRTNMLDNPRIYSTTVQGIRSEEARKRKAYSGKNM